MSAKIESLVEEDKAVEGIDKAVAGVGNDGIVLTKTNPIRSSDESRRRRRDLTEQVEEGATKEKPVDSAVAEKTAVIEEGELQYTDAQGVRLL